MSHKIDTVIVGGGQAGLAVSYYLKQEGREHVVFEQAPAIANVWRNHRLGFVHTEHSELAILPAGSGVSRRRP